MDSRASRAVTAESVVAAVDAQWGSKCSGCATELLGHDVVLGLLMGPAGSARCATCLARGLGDALPDFLARGRASVRRLGCYRAGWVHSDRRVTREGAWARSRVPVELRLDMLEASDDGAEESTVANAAAATTPAVAAHFDAGDMGCGDLVLELRARLAPLAAGDVLLVRATDPGAPGDLPAWCRVTHHTLVHHDHPHYWIRRRDDAPSSPTTST
jgi:tRNA 2-thiouridine synthesizing protein A